MNFGIQINSEDRLPVLCLLDKCSTNCSAAMVLSETAETLEIMTDYKEIFDAWCYSLKAENYWFKVTRQV